MEFNKKIISEVVDSFLRPKPKGVSPVWMGQIATALSKKYAVTIKEGAGWAMDVNTGTLTYNKRHAYAVNRDVILGLLLHEVGHLRFTEHPSGKLTEKEREATHLAVNALEDIRVNEFMSKDYAGSRRLIKYMNASLNSTAKTRIKQMLRDVAKKQDSLEDTDKRKQMGFLEFIATSEKTPYYLGGSSIGAVLWSIYVAVLITVEDDGHFLDVTLPNEINYSYTSGNENTAVFKDFVSLVYKIADIVQSKGVSTAKDTQYVYDVYESDIRPLLIPLLGDPNDNKLSQDEKSSIKKNDTHNYVVPAQNTDQEEDGQGEQNGESESESDSQESGQSQESEQQSQGNSGNQNGGGVSQNKSDAQKDADDDKNDTIIRQFVRDMVYEGNQNTDKDHSVDASTGKKVQQNRRDSIISDYSKQQTDRLQQKINRYGVQHHSMIGKHKKDMASMVTNFKRKFAPILKEQAFTKVNGMQKRGSIDQRRLYRVRMDDDKVFKRESEPQKSYAFSVMVDCSGSMSNIMMRNATATMIALAETLESARVPVEIGYYSSESDIVKKFEDKLSIGQLERNTNRVIMHGTLFMPLFKAMIRRLFNRTEKSKVMIVLTDGEWYHQETTKFLQFFKGRPQDMSVYLIRLTDSSWSRREEIAKIYPDVMGDCFIISNDNASDLPEKFAKIVEKHINQ